MSTSKKILFLACSFCGIMTSCEKGDSESSVTLEEIRAEEELTKTIRQTENFLQTLEQQGIAVEIDRDELISTFGVFSKIERNKIKFLNLSIKLLKVVNVLKSDTNENKLKMPTPELDQLCNYAFVLTNTLKDEGEFPSPKWTNLIITIRKIMQGIADIEQIDSDLVDDDPTLLSGVYSVSPTKKVRFAMGDLYCTKIGEGMYHFANEKNQYDFHSRQGYEARIDGELTENPENTSGYFAWDINAAVPNGDYGAFHDPEEELTGSETDIIDWGRTLGENWTTITRDEANYLLYARVVNGGIGNGYAYENLCVKMKNGEEIIGLCIFPDDFKSDEHPELKSIKKQRTRSGDIYRDLNCTVEDLTKMGIVFFINSYPRLSRDSHGHWTLKAYDDRMVPLAFHSINYARHIGQSVRLMKELK